MPKKRAPTYDTKPSIPAHPSLSSSGKPKDASHSLGSGSSTNGNSVNERLHQLRLSQGSHDARVSSEVLSPAANPSLPPALRNILQLPDAAPPRPRPGLRITGRLRGPAGPVPPSWLSRRENRPNTLANARTLPAREEMPIYERLPGSVPLHDVSLIATTLKAIAKNWDWHLQYDQYYLATILVRYKEELLHYIRCYSPRGMDRAGLELLFLDDTEVEDATGAEGLTHLDLSTFIGNSLKLTELRHLFTVKKAVESAEENSESLPESWDAPELVAQPSGLPRFYSLTHLSLARPNPATASWKGLLDLAPHLATITHLSLAYWPTPTLAPNSKTAYRETPHGNVNYGASNFYSAYDDDWSEAASIIRRLSKSTYCLKWLDLVGCWPWAKALERLDWSESLQALETVRIGQGWIPECFKDDDERAWNAINRLEMPPLDTHFYNRRAAIINWIHKEPEILSLEANINARISADIKYSNSRIGAARPARERGHGDSEWTDQSPEPSSVKCRSTRLTFDRGWNAWWIRKAIEEIVNPFAPS